MKTWCSDRGNTVWDKVFDNQHQHQHHHKQHQKPPERPICRLGLGAQGTQVWCSFKLVWMTTELLVTSYPGLWITEKFGWRGNRWPCRPLSCHTIPRVLSTHWHSFTGAHMSLLLSGREGVRLLSMWWRRRRWNLMSKGERSPICSSLLSLTSSCSSLLLLLTIAGLPTGLTEWRLTRVWKRLTCKISL